MLKMYQVSSGVYQTKDNTKLRTGAKEPLKLKAVLFMMMKHYGKGKEEWQLSRTK